MVLKDRMNYNMKALSSYFSPPEPNYLQGEVHHAVTGERFRLELKPAALSKPIRSRPIMRSKRLYYVPDDPSNLRVTGNGEPWVGITLKIAYFNDSVENITADILVGWKRNRGARLEYLPKAPQQMTKGWRKWGVLQKRGWRASKGGRTEFDFSDPYPSDSDRGFYAYRIRPVAMYFLSSRVRI